MRGCATAAVLFLLPPLPAAADAGAAAIVTFLDVVLLGVPPVPPWGSASDRRRPLLPFGRGEVAPVGVVEDEVVTDVVTAAASTTALV